MLISEYMR